MFYKLIVQQNEEGFIYPIDINLIFSPVYNKEYTELVFQTDNEIEIVDGVTEITKEEFDVFLDDYKNSIELTPKLVEEKPSEIEDLRSQVLLLEETLMFILSGGE